MEMMTIKSLAMERSRSELNRSRLAETSVSDAGAVGAPSLTSPQFSMFEVVDAIQRDVFAAIIEAEKLNASVQKYG